MRGRAGPRGFLNKGASKRIPHLSHADGGPPPPHQVPAFRGNNESLICQEMSEEQSSTNVLKKRNNMAAEEDHGPLISKRRKDNSTKVTTSISSNIPPHHILFQILLLLPLKSLLRCKSVCKLWLSIVSDPLFVAAHLDRAKTSPKFAVLPLVKFVDRDLTVYSYVEGSRRADLLFTKEFKRLQERFVILTDSSGLGTLTELSILNPSRRLSVPQHSNGLFLLETVAELYVFNPSTRQVVTLPPGDSYALVTNMRYSGIMERAGFGYDSYSGVYKVARYFNRFCREDHFKIDLGFEVFTLGVDSSWRVIDDATYDFSTSSNPVSAGGGIYYLMKGTKVSLDSSLLLRFDLRNEEFTVVPPPPLVTQIKYTHFYMAEMEGIVVLSTFQSRKEIGKKMDMWKLVEETWVHSCCFGIDLCEQIIRPFDFRPVAMRQGKLVLQIAKTIDEDAAFLAFYDPGTKSVEKRVWLAKDLAYYNHHNLIPRYFRRESCSSFQVVSYVESLVSCMGNQLWPKGN